MKDIARGFLFVIASDSEAIPRHRHCLALSVIASVSEAIFLHDHILDEIPTHLTKPLMLWVFFN